MLYETEDDKGENFRTGRNEEIKNDWKESDTHRRQAKKTQIHITDVLTDKNKSNGIGQC